MNSRVIPLLFVAAALLMADAAQAQNAAEYCAGIYPSPQVGEYAELEIDDPVQGSAEIRFSVVAREPVDGITYYWIEVATIPPPAGVTIIVQMLVPGWPFDLSDIKGYVVKLPGEPARKLPEEMIQRMGTANAALGWEEACETAEALGTDQVTVSAGTFEAEHFRTGGGNSGEVWLSTNVPFGIIKFVQAEGTMQLLGFGTGAKSAIDEEPIELELPPPAPPPPPPPPLPNR